jgi:hypothetical protein
MHAAYLNLAGATHAELSVDGVCGRKADLMAGAQQAQPAISKSDEHFQAMGLEFVSGTDELSIADLNDLFSRVRATSKVFMPQAGLPN